MDNNTFSTDQAQEILEKSGQEAQELVQDPVKMEELLRELPEKLQAVPGVGGILKDIPLTIALVKSFVAGEYRAVSPQIILPVVGAFAYLFKKKDLIRDSIPVLGYADDLAVLGLALKAIEPELEAFEAWQKGEMPEEGAVAAAEEASEESAAAEEASEESDTAAAEALPEEAAADEPAEESSAADDEPAEEDSSIEDVFS